MCEVFSREEGDTKERKSVLQRDLFQDVHACYWFWFALLYFLFSFLRK